MLLAMFVVWFMWPQLVDGHTLFDYNVGLNEIIQILLHKPLPSSAVTASDETPVEETTSDTAASVRLRCSTST